MTRSGLFCALLAYVAAAVDPDQGRSMQSLVLARGYPIEDHYIPTEDGFILGAFRIPYGKAGATTGKRPVVFLQHGLLDSSFTWVNNFGNQSLAYILADAGYDVWMGNSRGNTFSMGHKTLKPDSKEFWDFSFDEMAKYDLPAQLYYVLNYTHAANLSYVGHSQGTIQAFAAFSTNYDLASRVNIFAALAPVAYVHHQKSAVLSLLAGLDAASILEMFGFNSFLPSSSLIDKLLPGICDLIDWGCEDVLFLLVGKSNNLNETRIPVYMSETPAGTSTKNMIHWSQGVRKETFAKYDYGCEGGIFGCKNEEHYHQKTPPVYDLSKIKVPTALFFGDLDDLADLEDVQTLVNDLPSSTVVYTNRQPLFAHMDFTWGKDANPIMYPALLKLIQSRNPV